MPRQIKTRPQDAMKLIASGVTFSAAIMRSPSFSRSSSSTMMIKRPSCISAMASSIVANCIWLQQVFNILCQDIELQVHRILRPGRPQVRIFERMWNYCDRKNIRIQQRRYSQADAVHGDRAFFDKVTLSGFRIFHFKVPSVTLPHEFPDMAHAVHMTLHDVSAESGIGAHWPLQIDNSPFVQAPEARPIERLARHFPCKRPACHRADRQANAVHGYARAGAKIVEYQGPLNTDNTEFTAVLDFEQLTDFFNDPCEHMQSTPRRARTS